MCLTPLKVRNNSKVIYTSAHPYIYQYVRCGRCCECQQQKSNEYLFRSYYQAYNAIDKGGFVLFDTLTYKDKYLPQVANVINREFGLNIPLSKSFSCFDYTDVIKFLKRLRKILPTKKLTYYLTSEYGTLDFGTHRPHYHVLFFYAGNDLSPLRLSKLISKCWYFGRTDGLPYQSSSYVKNNRVISDLNSGITNLVKYVSKYIEKDSEFQQVVNDRLGYVKKMLCNIDPQYTKSYYGKLHYRSVLRHISPFHRQSHGFGLRALEFVDIDTLQKNNGFVDMPRLSLFKTRIKLPMYYHRKLFQYESNDEFGNRKWYYNTQGIKYMKNLHNKRLKLALRTFENRFLNYSDDVKQQIVNLLDGRSFYDYIRYVTIYKDRYHGRCKSFKFDDGCYINSLYCHHRFSYLFNFSQSKEVASLGYAAVYNPFASFPLACYQYDFYFSNVTLNERNVYEFRDFDKIGRVIYHADRLMNKDKEDMYLHKKYLHKQYKMIFS